MSTSTRPRQLTVQDVMTTTVVTVSGSATFHEVAELMQRHGISAVPVVEADRGVIGIVSEADLLVKAAPPDGNWLLWAQSRDQHLERVKAAGTTAADVMTSPVVTARPDEPLARAARRMRDHKVKRLTVIADDGTLVGIVSRRDLLSAYTRDDEDIRLDIVDGVLPRWLGVDPKMVDVSVAGGIVLLRGGLPRSSDGDTLVHLITGLDGVVEVNAELRYDYDDSKAKPSREARVR